MSVRLNVDAGEFPDEPEELIALADLVNVACGGHAGEAASMRHVITVANRHGTRIGAHPSYVDRAGFGRVASELAADVVASQVVSQVRALVGIAASLGVRMEFVKPHGALYHRLDHDTSLAEAVVAGVAAIVSATWIGPAGSALERAATARGLAFLREGFADRGVDGSGRLLPRSHPGALLDVAGALARTRTLLAAGTIDTLCLHADTPGALDVARAVRSLLGPKAALP